MFTTVILEGAMLRAVCSCGWFQDTTSRLPIAYMDAETHGHDEGPYWILPTRIR